MAVFGLDNNGDLAFTKNGFVILTGQQEVIQNVETRLKEQVFDCFVNLNAGIDWLNPPRTLQEREVLTTKIRNVVANTNGVQAVTDITSQFDSITRKLTFQINYITRFSNENVSQLLASL
jgi:hypothetical protein